MFKKHNFHFNWLPLILISTVSIMLIFNIRSILSEGIRPFLSVLTPFFWAFGIAYLINPLMMLIEKKFKLKRAFSLMISYILVIICVYILIAIIVPTIFDSLSELFSNISEYASSAESWINNTLASMNVPLDLNHLNTSATEFISKTSTLLSNIVGSLLTQTIKITSSVVKFVFGFIISIYMLMDKETLIEGCKKIIVAVMPSEKSSELFISFMAEAHNIFSRFIIGKIIDSLIIGVLCYIGLLLMGTQYAVLISFIVGLTNMIPYFGPFIGMIPAFLLTLIVQPSMAIWVLLFIFILQQFDGWYLGPKILGDQVGVSPLFIIFAVTVGGGIFGVLGMFLSVPIIALIKIYTEKFIEYRLENKKQSFSE
uniref:AI-2E family transporter n=1 Tax=Clostridium perfringens TaxID=1502 RepID=UPI0039ED04FD